MKDLKNLVALEGANSWWKHLSLSQKGELVENWIPKNKTLQHYQQHRSLLWNTEPGVEYGRVRGVLVCWSTGGLEGVPNGRLTGVPVGVLAGRTQDGRQDTKRQRQFR